VLPSGDVGGAGLLAALFTALAVADLLLGTAIPVVIIIYMLKFTKSYPERVSHTEASAPATS
jgi:hypothetical protein